MGPVVAHFLARTNVVPHNSHGLDLLFPRGDQGWSVGTPKRRPDARWILKSWKLLGEMVSWVNFWGFIFLSGPAGHVGHVGSTAPAASCQHGLSEVGGLSELVLWRPPRRGANLPSKHGDINKKTGMVGLLGES